MNYEVTVVLAVLAGAVVLFLSERVRPDVVGVLIVAALGVTRVLGPDELLAGFGNQAVLTIGAMFVLSAALMRTGVVNQLGVKLTDWSHGQPWRFRALTIAVVAVLSAFVNNTPVVVVFIPAVLTACRRFGGHPSKFLMPLSYAAILGGNCTLIGTSTNILASSIADDLYPGGLHMFEFAWIGVPLALIGMTYILLFADRRLPARPSFAVSAPPEAVKNYVTQVTITEGSPLIGKRLSETFLAAGEAQVVELIRGDEIRRLARNTRLRAGDALLVRAELNEILELERKQGVSVIPEEKPGATPIRRIEMTLAELMITPDSLFVGRTCRQARLRSHYGVSAFAIQRGGRHIEQKIADTELEVGDILLVRGPTRAVDNLRDREAFTLLEGVQQKVVETHKAPLALGVIAAVIALATLEVLPISVLALAGVAVVILTRVVSPRDAYRAIDWPVLVLIAGAIALGQAMQSSGAAALLARGVLRVFGASNPWLTLYGVFFVTMVLTAFMSNNASVVLLTPLAISIAQSMGVDPKPFIMAVCFASSGDFSTPIGYQTNLLVYGPGEYLFRDYLRFGLPLNLAVWLTASTLIPLVWPFHP